MKELLNDKEQLAILFEGLVSDKRRLLVKETGRAQDTGRLRDYLLIDQFVETDNGISGILVRQDVTDNLSTTVGLVAIDSGHLNYSHLFIEDGFCNNKKKIPMMDIRLVRPLYDDLVSRTREDGC